MRARENPFAPPKSAPSTSVRPRGSPVAAVVLGVLTDIGGSFLAGFLMVIATAIAFGLQGMPPEEVEATITNVDPMSGRAILTYGVGLVFSVLGGYVCARVARRSEFKLAGIVAAIGSASGWILGGGQLPLLLHVFLICLSVACVMFGAWVSVRSNERRA